MPAYRVGPGIGKGVIPSNSPLDVTDLVFEGIRIRTALIEGQQWWVANDIMDALGTIAHTNLLDKVDDDERCLGLIQTTGGRQMMRLVNESGLYCMILRCHHAVVSGSRAHRFRKWVTNEVLPQIRQTGQYVAPAPQDEPAPPAEESLDRWKVDILMKTVDVLSKQIDSQGRMIAYLTRRPV